MKGTKKGAPKKRPLLTPLAPGPNEPGKKDLGTHDLSGVSSVKSYHREEPNYSRTQKKYQGGKGRGT